MALILGRQTGQSVAMVTTDGTITVTVIAGGRLAIDAPASVRIVRVELLPEEEDTNGDGRRCNQGGDEK